MLLGQSKQALNNRTYLIRFSLGFAFAETRSELPVRSLRGNYVCFILFISQTSLFHLKLRSSRWLAHRRALARWSVIVL